MAMQYCPAFIEYFFRGVAGSWIDDYRQTSISIIAGCRCGQAVTS